MADDRALRPCTRADIEAAQVGLVPGRPLPMLFLLLGRGEEAGARSRVAQAVLLKTRENGFLVALPTPEIVVQFVEGLVGEDDEELVLSFRSSAEFETSRGRALGSLDVLLADFPWAGTEHFTRARSLRGAAEKELELSAFTSGGVNARPVPASLLRAAEDWIRTEMDLETAAEYHTGEEVAEPDEPVEVEERPTRKKYAALQARLEAMEARAREPLRPVVEAAPPGLRTGRLFGAGAGELDETALDRLQRLAGPVPRRVKGPEPQPTAQGGHFREAELEALAEPAAEDPFTDLVDSNPLHQILVAQLAQNKMLLERLAPQRNLDAVSAALGSGGASGSGDSTGIKGCLARDAFLRQVQDLPRVAEVARQNALRELGLDPANEEPNLMKLYLERRVPLAGHRLLGHFAYLGASAWEVGQTTGNRELQGFAARLLIFAEQAAIDGGRLQLGWLMSGYAEPPPQLWSVQRRSSLKPFSSLAHPAWAAANIAYLRDLDFLETKMATINKDRSKEPKEDAPPEAGGAEAAQKTWREKRKAKPKALADGA